MKTAPSSVRRRAGLLLAAAGLIAGSLTALVPTAAEAAGPLPTSTTLASSASVITAGSPVTLTANVSALGLGGLLLTPSGAVRFDAVTASGTTLLGSANLGALCFLTPCTAALTTSTLPVGNVSVVASYAGDTLTAASSGSTAVTVNQPPRAPVLTAATAGDSKVTVSWNQPTDPGSSAVVSYQIFRSTTAGQLGTTIGQINAPTTTYVDTTVSNGTTYWYSVVASNATNASPPSNQLSASPAAGVPGAPVLSGPTSALDKLTISWTAPASTSAITGYQVYRATAAGVTTGAPLASVAAGTTTYVDTTVTAPTRYYYTVVATNVAGAGARSNEVNGVPVPPTVPGAPTLTATQQIGSIQLSWASASSGGRAITSYRLYRSTTATGTYTLIATDLPTGRYQETTVPVGTTYYYRATSVNSVGESPVSNTASSSAAAYSGASSYSTTPCAPGVACNTATASGTSGAGWVSSGRVDVESSTGSHTATVAVGGPILTGCGALPVAGLSVTFNDTSTDAYKTVTVTYRGQEADDWHNFYAVTTGFEGCLGLGTPWFAGSLSNPAVWNAADGLYEAAPPSCANNGAFFVSAGHYSQPCFTSSYGPPGPVANRVLTLVYRFPPGDGRISGGKCC
ncbi:MAG: hypothetical protein F2667_01510 [Actinobacteria bacterium]|uniref:Unannotated protein n=1 Tax=freshwater metagenome TaxID=449393 RepID=A0A6J6NQR1_9ZZZZ|nr:hypothetical protein [Actinomycetota bacterium]